MKRDLTIVTGAPGSGKTTTLNALLEMGSDFLAFDIDWLADTAGRLAGKSISSDSSTWEPYGALWFEVLHSIYRNAKQPVFFTPNSPADIESIGKPHWCGDIRWLLLDCDDPTRKKRLDERSDWSAERKAEALEDATELRESVKVRIDTGAFSPSEVASKVLLFAKDTAGSS